MGYLSRALLAIIALLVACGAPAQPPPSPTRTGEEQAARNVELTQVAVKITATAEARASAARAVPTATAAPAPKPSPTPRVIVVPEGWSVFSAQGASLRIAYPGDWEATEEVDEGEVRIDFYAPDETARVLVYGFDAYTDFRTLTKEQWRALFAEVYGDACDRSVIEEPVENRIAGVPFIGVGMRCEVSSVPLYGYFAAGATDWRGWLVGYVTDEADFERNFETYFAPMLNSLELGRR